MTIAPTGSSKRSPSQLRATRFYSRQNPQAPTWGAQYEPAIKAVRGEAPARSCATVISAPRKIGRPLHFLSTIEAAAALLALYNPRVFDLHEQKLLDPDVAPHPLHGHPQRVATGHQRHLPGTFAIAQHLGLSHLHPRLTFRDHDGRRWSIPHPLVGDLLLFVETEQDKGAGYCVNWTIKADATQFSKPFSDRTVRHPTKAEEKLAARHAIEKEFYRVAGIPTHQITERDLPTALIQNLGQTYEAHLRPPIRNDDKREVIRCLIEALDTARPPLEVYETVRFRCNLTFEQFRDTLLSAVWNRDLKVDLFQRLLFDRPLEPETTDVLSVFASWFRLQVAE